MKYLNGTNYTQIQVLSENFLPKGFDHPPLPPNALAITKTYLFLLSNASMLAPFLLLKVDEALSHINKIGDVRVILY